MKYWLFKTEPDRFSVDDLASAKGQRTSWDGVRNHQARNFLRDGVRIGDPVLLYHSSSSPRGIAGICEVVGEARSDPTALDPKSDGFDPRARAGVPGWVTVEIRLKEKFERLLPLEELRLNRALKDMELLRRGSRLSIQPVTPRQFQAVLAMAQKR